MNKIITFLQHLFCRHSWHYKGWYEEYDSVRYIRHSMHIYVCRKCGKWVEVDGRFDKIKNST